MKYIINGIVSIVKLCIILYAAHYAIESGLIEYVIKLFWYGSWSYTSVYVVLYSVRCN